MSRAATRAMLRRQWRVFADARFERLAGLSNGHLYNLRRSRTYRNVRRVWDRTRAVAVAVAIGVRRRPEPRGRPGFVRVNTVHQGDLDGVKGVYHINVVDEVTQWQHVGTVAAISERFLIPVLEALIEAFPFGVKGFHADNGSEYINHRVAELLNKLHVGEFTKSRARRSNDNALVESKNASVVRKWLGYAHIPAHFAEPVNAFNRDWLSPFLNYHRPCLFPTEETDEKGRVQKRYRDADVMTPYEKLKSLEDADRHRARGHLRGPRPDRPSLERLVGYPALEIECLKGLLKKWVTTSLGALKVKEISYIGYVGGRRECRGLVCIVDRRATVVSPPSVVNKCSNYR